MVTEKIKELEAARAKLADLEQSLAAQLSKELAALPAQYGFDSAADFIQAVKAATGGGGGAKRGRKAGGKTAGGKRRRRAVITDETRASVKKMVSAGKTGGEIARELGISLPSVQNIKKSLGLVKARKG